MKAYPFLGKFIVTSLYGVRGQIKTSEGYASRDHKGIDLVGQGSINVVACEGGVVTKAEYGFGLGYYVWVYTDSGYGNIYQHLKEISVRPGDRVTCKQKIGVMGNTGNSSGPHLHFGVASNPDFKSYYSNNWINPAIWWGMNSPATIKGKMFDGNGYISGNPSSTTSENNNAASVTVSQGQTTSGYLNAITPSGEFYEVTNFVGTVGDWLYGRKYRILIDIGGGKAFDVSELRCTFEIIKTAYLEANQSILSIYNLNPDDENKLIKQGQRIVIEAGYQGSQYGMIFSGNIIQPLRSKEGNTDYVLTLVSMDADRYATYGLIGVSLVAQQSSRDAVGALLSKSSQEVGSGYLTETSIKYPRGKVMFGMSKDYLSQIARAENSTCFVEDGKVNLVSPKDVEKGNILAFGPRTGLIGSPTQTEMGIECEVLLNPQVKINTLFYVDNKKIQNYRYSPGSPVRSLDSQGIYRVVKLTHYGDTRGNEWRTKIEAISQAGLLPGMMAGNSIYAW